MVLKLHSVGFCEHSVLAKTIVWYLNGTNIYATSMQVISIPGTLYNLPNPHQSNDWCDVKNGPTLMCGLHAFQYYKTSGVRVKESTSLQSH